MVRFLFWNVQGGTSLTELLAAGFAAGEFDVLVLAEAGGVGDLVSATAALGVAVEEDPGPEDPANAKAPVRMFVRSNAVVVEGSLWQAWRERYFLLRVGGTPVVVAAVHLPSKLHAKPDDQRLACVDLVLRIVELEAEWQAPAIVVGDLNLNPYETGARVADALHAFMAADSLPPEGRLVRGKMRRGFYNPMWSLFGDRSPGPPATYHRRGGADSTDWEMFDQVMVRPELVSRLHHVEILSTLAGRPLGDKMSRPASSDHFPIRFVLQPPGAP